LNIAVFGSVARGDAKLGSDIDLMVKVPDDTNAFRLTGIQSDLQETLGVRVEIVTLK
jgi:predicted nucleotidyltransferase